MKPKIFNTLFYYSFYIKYYQLTCKHNYINNLRLTYSYNKIEVLGIFVSELISIVVSKEASSMTLINIKGDFSQARREVEGKSRIEI